MSQPHVILRRCNTYDVEKICRIIHESLDELETTPSGRTFIKPNIVSANKRYIHDSFTHPAVVEAMVEVLRDRETRDITIGESGGYGIPSRLFFRESGHREMAERLGVKLVDLNEHPVTEISLEKAAWHKSMLLSNYIRDAQWKVWMPKLKFHIFACITNALKLNIGILTHKERMLYHDHRIHEKIVDLLEPGMPDLIVSDAVRITYGFESAPYPVDLGVLMVADQPLAADVVAAHIMGYEPETVAHLKIASNRGYGSLALEDIKISGDADIEELRAKPKGNRRLFQHLSELETPIRFYAGCAPGTATICDGGCEGAVKGCLGTIEKRSPGALKGARPGAIVTGRYNGDVIVPEGPAILIGDCTEVSGKLEAKKVHRVKGCPIGARDLFIKVPMVFRMPSPMLDPRDASLFILDSVGKAMSILKNRALR